MKKMFKKITALIISAVILVTTLVISPFSAFAVSTAEELEGLNLQIWADPENVLTQEDVNTFNGGDKLATLGGINPFKRSTSSEKYYLFLPSTADCTALKLWFNGTLTIGGVEIVSGQPTNVFQDLNEGGITREYTFTFNGTGRSVTVLKSGDVGTVYIDTNSGSLSAINDKDHEGEEPGSIMVVQPNGDVDYMGIMSKISGRGNGTWNEGDGTKLPYNINLEKSASLLDMPSSKKWCLLANAGDSSLVKNQITYDFAKYIGVKYQPVCKPVDLYVNQQYLGSYQLSERVQIKSNKINITDAFENLQIANGTTDPTTGIIIPADFDVNVPQVVTTGGSSSTLTNGTGHTVGAYKSSPSLKDPTDYTGGYLYELEISNRWVNENAGFCAYNRQGWVIKNVDYASENMVKYSYDLLYALGSSVYNGGVVPSVSTTTNCSDLSRFSEFTYGARSITNPAPASQYQGKKWNELLDADSAVRYYWTQEFFKNMDSSTSSTYFYKELDSIDTKLYAGPMWDMDNSIGYGMNGSRWGYSWTSSDGWYTKNARIYRWRSNDSDQSYSKDTESPLNFYAALATNCSDFWDMAEEYWYTYISPAVDIIAGRAVDTTGVLKSASEYLNTVAKSGTMNNLRHNLDNDGAFNTQYHISAMTTWFNERQSWINSQIPQINMSNNSSITMESVGEHTFTGSPIHPTPVVKDGDKILQEGVDYTYSYADNTNAGSALVSAVGKGYYTGQITGTFNIVRANLANCTAQIDANAYKDMTLEAVVTDASGNELTAGMSYQWYRDGVALAGETNSQYVTVEGDVGSLISVTVTGDGYNVEGSVSSNTCNIIPGSRPEGYTRTLASWDYDYTAASQLLVNGNADDTDYYYYATSGENKDTAILRASVNATSSAKIKWSGSADLFVNEESSVLEDESPVMGTSKTDGLAWGEYPYFQTTLSTAGYENITFSARLGGTKKAPRDWKLQYSLNGTDFTDVTGATYSITENKSMELAFNDIILPQECNNQRLVYIRIVVNSNTAINGIDTIVNQTSGDASVNNIHIKGSSLKVVTELYAPDFSVETGSRLYDDDVVSINDNNGGAPVYYSINGGEEMIYTGSFSPFDAKTATLGDTAEIVAYAKFNDVKSEKVTAVYTFAGVNIMSFAYETYSTDVTAGAVASTGGVYDQSGRMTAYADGKTQYIPLWNEDNKAFSVAPDDTMVWSENSGFTYQVTTAGYENVTFSCQAYTTAQGPKSVSLQYSLDGVDYYDVSSNVVLSANSLLEDLFVNAKLPQECDNKSTVYIRLVTAENLTNSGEPLWNNNSKGNLYVNNVTVAGEDNGTFKMPYTNKSTDYFGSNGVIEYVSPDGMDMTYMVLDEDNSIVQSGTYPQTGIQLSTVEGFEPNCQEKYTVLIYVTEDEDESLVNTRTYQYKGDSVVKFNFNSSSNLFENYVSSDFKSVTNTGGANSGKLSMYPNGYDATTLDYTGTYGVKVAWAETNFYYFDIFSGLNNPDNELNGYWLIETSSLGYKGLTLNVEQLSSNQGPRDWGVAYSTNGSSYTYIDNSNARAISNDASADTVETYGNLKLPSECDNQEKLFIKIFINGGEGVDGTELELATKGNTGINAVEISGVEIARTLTVKTSVMETPETDGSSIPWANVSVAVDGVDVGTTDVNGELVLKYEAGSTHTVTVTDEQYGSREYTVTLDENAYINAGLFVFDLNNDGIVNAKDYAMMLKDGRYSQAKELFKNFINFDCSNFTYAQ